MHSSEGITPLFHMLCCMDQMVVHLDQTDDPTRAKRAIYMDQQNNMIYGVAGRSIWRLGTG